MQAKELLKFFRILKYRRLYLRKRSPIEREAMKVLVIAPHPDDEVLGCGGTIAKFSSEGHEIALCIVTKAYAPEWTEKYLLQKTNEIKKSNEVLGITQTFFLDFPTIKLDAIRQKEINDAITGIILNFKPDIVFIPHKGDLNRDHRIVFQSSLVALRPVQHKTRQILSYEVPSETEWGREIYPFVPQAYVDVTAWISKKIDAMRAYQTELKDCPHPRSVEVIEALGRIRGSEIFVPYAEAFMVIREFI
jgi:LmbE family N-acetylglucosaminyl deacetylase